MSLHGLNAGIPYAEGQGGVVAAKHVLAARAGVEMLQHGGNAIDAAVATAFAVGVVEPWMSGLGGIGYMVIQPGSGDQSVVVDYGPVAPRTARADMFESVDGQSPDLFPWPLTRDDAHHQGWRSVVVPGTARGLGLALRRFGRLDLAHVLGPAIRLARHGFPVSWYAALRIAMESPTIARYPETARTFLPNQWPPSPPPSDELPAQPIVQPELAQTLERLAEDGVDEFYTGETARRIVAGMRAGGGLIDAQDLATYRAQVSPAQMVSYKGWRVGTPGGATGGTTLAGILELLESRGQSALYGSVEYVDRMLRSFSDAFARRYAQLGGETVIVGSSGAAEPIGTSTTHLAVVDSEGTVVSCTQTLLSAFGSHVTVPATGVLLNNGMYWFDPRPGQANSVGPAKRPLNNMAPLVAIGPGGWPRIGLGSSGGRHIVSANAQILLAMVDGGLSLDEALRAPRMDASGERMLADNRLPPTLLADLQRRGWSLLVVEESPFPRHFASPTAVAAYADGRQVGAADQFMPAAVVAV